MHFDRVLTVDFELYFDDEYTLTKLTTEEFVRDPRFQVIGVSVKFMHEPAVWLTDTQFRYALTQIRLDEAAVLAHHAHLEALILSHHYGIRPGFWLDTLSMERANSHHLRNDLGSILERRGIGHKGDAPDRYKGRRLETLTAEEWNDYGDYARNDADTEWALFLQLLPGFPLDELKLIDITVRMFSEPALVADIPFLTAFAEYEDQRRAAMLEANKLEAGDFRSEVKFAEILRARGVEPGTKKPAKPRKDGREWTYAFAKDDPFMQILLDHEDDDIRQLAEARVAFKSVNALSRTRRILASAHRGPLPIYVAYSKAHTHRWGGGDKMNPQNWDRVKRDRQKKPIGWTGAIRRSIKAPPGQLIRVADLSQIEPRLTAYVANETWMLDAFRDPKVDLYSKQASEIYRRPVDRKANPDDEVPGQMGKACVIGLGYKQGTFRFAWECLKGPFGNPPQTFTMATAEQLGVDVNAFMSKPHNVRRALEMPRRLNDREILIHCAVADAFVRRYRASVPAIEGFWELAETVIRAMAEGAVMRFGGPTGELLETGPGYTTLPGSGVYLRYPELRWRDSEEFEKRGWRYRTEEGWAKVHGGVYTNNVVQWLARMKIAGDMIAVHEAGIRISMFNHDEIDALGPADTARADLATMYQIMRRPPRWAPDLPLNVDGGVGEVFGDIK